MRRLVAGLLTALLVLVGAGAVPAYADGEIGLSEDGLTWSDRLPGPLFDPAVRWVPGDVRTEAFHVRNQAEDAATLRLEVRADDADGLRLGGDLTLAARVGDDPWVVLPRSGDAFVLYGEELGPGDRAHVLVRASFAPESTNQSQAADLGLRFRVVLTDARASGGADPTDADDDTTVGDVLPGTGAPVVGWLLLLSAGLVGAGLALVRGRREVGPRE